MKKDVNDTLRTEGIGAVQSRSDNAKSYRSESDIAKHDWP
jgi:hypothetical protein